MSVVTAVVIAGSLIASLPMAANVHAMNPAAAATMQASSRSESEQTTPVERGSRVALDDCEGTVTVRTWSQSSVRARATGVRPSGLHVNSSGRVVVISSESRDEPVNLEVTVPEWIGLDVSGRACSVDVEGISGAVAVEVVEGVIALRALTGAVDASAVDGTILIEGGRGRVRANTVDGEIRIAKATGQITADSVDGDIVLENVDASAIEASTVDGDISFSGAFTGSGRYTFTTHDGDVALVIPANSNATFGTRSFSGGKVDSTIPLQQTSSSARGRRTTFTLGSGAAQVEVESFDGAIRIRPR